MRSFHAFAVAAFLAVSAPALAQSPAPQKPTCAAGDPVVWVNSSSKVYHMQGDKYYGNTKHGNYACKSAADAAGDKPSGQKKSKSAMASPAPGASASPAAMTKKQKKAMKMASPAPGAAASPAPAAT
jgi:hypothetical protein